MTEVRDPAVQTHEATHTVITPSVLYFGTPVGLISTLNRDGTTNLSPVSSLFALGQRYAVGLGAGGQAAANLIDCPELVVNLPDAGRQSARRRACWSDRGDRADDWGRPGPAAQSGSLSI